MNQKIRYRYAITKFVTLEKHFIGRNNPAALDDYFGNVDNKVATEENKTIVLINSIKEGINSGSAKNFDPVKHLAKLNLPGSCITGCL